MITETSAYNFLCGEFYNMYKPAEAAGRLSADTDLPYGLELQDYWLDPTDSNLQFTPIDYQSFWICQDVNSTFYYSMKGDNILRSKFSNPRYSYQPQSTSYTYSPHSRNPMNGVALVVRCISPYDMDGPYDGNACVYLCANTSDTPGFLAGLQVGQLSCIKNGGTNGQTGSAGWEQFACEHMLSTANGTPLHLCGEIIVWSAPRENNISNYYTLQEPHHTTQLCAALSAFPRKIISETSYSNLYYYDSEQEINTNVLGNRSYAYPYIWATTDGKCKEHEFYRHNANDGWTERWGGRYDYETNINNYVQEITWSYDSWLSTVYCSKKTSRPPKNNEHGQNFRFYCAAPAMCFYGNLSADVYQTWYVDFGDWASYFWRKRVVEFERSDIFIDYSTTSYGEYFKFLSRYALQSKEAFTFQDAFCLWDPYDESDAIQTLNSLRSLAGLSAWQWASGPVPTRQEAQRYTHSCRVNAYETWVFQKFDHPLIMPEGYHFTNQDPPV